MDIDYNFSYFVNYFNIKQELLNKIKTSDIKEYTEDDIDAICQKLYIDEYSNAFNANDYMDDKVDVTLRKIYNLCLNNSELNNFINNIFLIYKNAIYKDTIISDEDEFDIKYISFLGLFSHNTFYLTHQLIQQIGTNMPINNELLNSISETFYNSLQ
jgi:hypothetical protein